METRMERIGEDASTSRLLEGFVPWPLDVAERYRRKHYWRGDTLTRLPAECAERFGNRIAVVSGEDRWSYREFNGRADGLATGLHRLGIGAHDRVVVQLPNIAAFFEILFALFKLGAVPVVVPSAYRRAEVSAFCRFTEAVAYVVVDSHGGFDFTGMAAEILAVSPALQHIVVVGDPGDYIGLDALREPAKPPLCPVDAGDVALLHLSGGTTGVPKLIPRTHNDYLYGARAAAELCGFTNDTVYLCSLPVAHQFSLSAPGAVGTFLSGGRVVLAPGPAPDDAFPLIEQEQVTVAAVVPPLLRVWLDAMPRSTSQLSSLRLLQVGGAKLDPDQARRVRPELGAQLQQVYGMTEGLLNFTRLDDPDDIVCTTQGRPLSPDDEIRIVDDDGNDVPAGEPGHLLVRGPNTIRGYYRAPEHNSVAFTEDGFYRTGDIVRCTSTGHLVVVGREKDQINRGGEKIAAQEVEYHLLAHPDVDDAAVVAIPDPFLGERICAFIVSAERAIEPKQLTTFMRRRGLADHKIPDRIEFIEALPRTPVGKINKQQLRQRAAATAAIDTGVR